MKIIYVAGPYRSSSEWGVIQNIQAAEEVAIKLWKKGWSVFCPHKNTAHFGGILPDKTWVDGGVEILRRCDAICMVYGWEQSAGANIEYDAAVAFVLPIYYGADEVPDMREEIK